MILNEAEKRALYYVLNVLDEIRKQSLGWDHYGSIGARIVLYKLLGEPLEMTDDDLEHVEHVERILKPLEANQ